MAKKTTMTRRAAKAAPKATVAKKAKKVKYVYFFGQGKAEGDRTMKDTLGGKGSGLAEMTNAGLPVPPGFTISTEVCTYFYDHGRKYPPALRAEVEKHLHRVEQATGRRFGDPKNPKNITRKTRPQIKIHEFYHEHDPTLKRVLQGSQRISL